MTRSDREHFWAVVLAGGEGRRLSRLTRALYGFDVPKQFAAFAGRRSLLQRTLDRLASLVPASRTVVVVGKVHETLARRQMRPYPEVDLALQPRNLDTGPGMFFPLSRILLRDPDARIAFFPSDHEIPRPRPFLSAVEEALDASREAPSGIALLGAVPNEPETEYGWILPGGSLDGGRLPRTRLVRGFVEKPDPARAERLYGRGGLWNTFVSVSSAAAFWELAERHLAEHTALFADPAPDAGGLGDEEALARLYGRMRPANFSREILERADGLAVVTVADSGWRDLGSAERLLRSLEGKHALRRLLDRLGTRTGT